MKTYSHSEKYAPFLKVLLTINFTAAIIFLAITSVVTLLGSSIFFEDYSDLYGPMDNNLRLMLIYLCVTEITVYSFCRYSNSYRSMILMGLFLLLMSVGVEYYGVINEVMVDDNYIWFFAYLGLSHLSFGLMTHSLKDYDHVQ